jgi:hypothetical protein
VSDSGSGETPSNKVNTKDQLTRDTQVKKISLTYKMNLSNAYEDNSFYTKKTEIDHKHKTARKRMQQQLPLEDFQLYPHEGTIVQLIDDPSRRRDRVRSRFHRLKEKFKHHQSPTSVVYQEDTSASIPSHSIFQSTSTPSETIDQNSTTATTIQQEPSHHHKKHFEFPELSQEFLETALCQLNDLGYSNTTVNKVLVYGNEGNMEDVLLVLKELRSTNIQSVSIVSEETQSVSQK